MVQNYQYYIGRYNLELDRVIKGEIIVRKILMMDFGIGEMLELRVVRLEEEIESILENIRQYFFRIRKDQVGRLKEEIDKGYGLIQRLFMFD